MAEAAAFEVDRTGTLLRLETGSGLSNNYVSAICKDDRGTIWIATEEGLNRVEGARIVSYFKNAAGLTDNALNDVLADSVHRRVWIATQRAGLCWIDVETHRFGVYRHDPADGHSLMTDDVTHIEQADDGAIWLSTYHQGMERLDVETEHFSHYNSSTVEGMPAAPIHSFCVVGKNVYISHYRGGFTVMDSETRTAVNYRHDPADVRSLPSDNVNCVTTDRNGRLWVGTSEGLALFLPESGEFVPCTRGAGIFAVLHRADGRLMLGTELGGVVEIDPREAVLRPVVVGVATGAAGGETARGFEETSRLSIRCMLEDDFGNLWIGTYGSGALVRSKSPVGKFGSWRAPYQFTEDKILSLSFDMQGRLWVGTDGGGVNVLGNNLLAERSSEALGCGVVLASLCDSEGQVWLGSYTRGSVVYDPRSDTFRRIPAGRDSDVRCFCEHDGEMWIGTSNGIFVMDRKTYRLERHYTSGDRLLDNLVRTLMFDDRGRLWVGTFGSGLGVYDRQMEPLCRYSTADSLQSNEINYIHQDRRGHIWVATGEGLVRIDPSSMRVEECYDRERGLPNDHIRAISEDQAGNIWFSTNVGIGCIDREGAISAFDHRDGVTVGNFSSNSVARSPDDLICFGSTQGVVYFQPGQLLVEYDAPRVRISEIQILDSDVAGRPDSQTQPELSIFCDEPVTLPYRQNNFRIWFGVTDFSLADKVEYAYKLDSDEWVTTESDHISFTRLSPGSYRILFRARIRNQAWSDEVAELYLTIRPPWYFSWYAMTVYVLAAIGLVVVGVLRYNRRVERERKLQYEYESMILYRQVNDERLRFFMNITHELRTPLTLIMGPLEDLQHDQALSAPLHEKVSIAYRSAQQLLTLVNELLEFRKTETGSRKLVVCFDDLSQCVEETGVLFRDSNLNPETRIELDIEEGVFAYFDSKIVTTILNNLLSNAMKYTPRGRVTLFLHTLSDQGVRYVEFGVSDTGYGMPEEALHHIFERYYRVETYPHIMGTGIGLALVKSLVTLHEATIDVESRIHEGSTFRVRLRLDNTYSDALYEEPGSPANGAAAGNAAPETAHAGGNLPGEAPSDTVRGGDFDDPEDPGNAAGNPDDNREVVLVVDDNVAIRRYIALSLEDRYHVITAPDGFEGIRLVREHMPDVVISDVVMPRVDGIELCRQIKQDIATCHIPVILLTAKDMLMDRTEGYAAGADSYITKPFSSSLLESRILNLLAMRRRLVDQLTSASRNKRTQAMNTLGSLDNEFLHRLNELIDRELVSDKLNVSYLSGELCMDASTLYRKIKGLTGISTNEYIRKRRLHKAAELLRSGRYKVFEVAWKVGMNSDNYFRQCFREEFGISPSEYRDADSVE